MELTVQISNNFGLQNVGTEQWAVCDDSNSNTNFAKDVNNETLTLNPETWEEFLDRDSENYL